MWFYFYYVNCRYITGIWKDVCAESIPLTCKQRLRGPAYLETAPPTDHQNQLFLAVAYKNHICRQSLRCFSDDEPTHHMKNIISRMKSDFWTFSLSITFIIVNGCNNFTIVRFSKLAFGRNA